LFIGEQTIRCPVRFLCMRNTRYDSGNQLTAKRHHHHHMTVKCRQCPTNLH